MPNGPCICDMAGLYVHIPFCKSRCSYCNFFSSTQWNLMENVVKAISKEITLRTDYLPQDPLSTIYWGGGTPSTLPEEAVEIIMQQIRASFPIDDNAEITIEVNPDDVTDSKADFWHKMGFNRVSMGIQSFDNKVLQTIRRRHTAEQAKIAVATLKQSGFNNISIDLIYALPLQDMQTWQQDISTALQLNVQHISSYGLSFEPDTPLYIMKQQGEVVEQEDCMYNEMYDLLCNQLQQHGFEHYEVSNFALPGYRSRHNSSYWNDIPYCGIGPGAHSYNGHSRQWNVEDLTQYINKLNQDILPCEVEHLTEYQKWEEYVMLRLRTIEGINLSHAAMIYGEERVDKCLQQASQYLKQGYLLHTNKSLHATSYGIKILNRIISDLID